MTADPSRCDGPTPRSEADMAEELFSRLEQLGDGDEDAIDAILMQLADLGPTPRVLALTRDALGDLSGRRGEVALRLVELFRSAELLEALADALEGQPDLAPERALAALLVLEGTGHIERRPALASWLEDLDELLDLEETLSEELGEELEQGEESIALTLRALSQVEPAIRAEIVEDLAHGPAGKGRIELLRLLAFGHDPGVRRAAFEGLGQLDPRDSSVRAAWSTLAEAHPDDMARAAASRRMEPINRPDPARVPTAPRPLDAMVSSLDGSGRGLIVLRAQDRGETVTVVFVCDVMQGIVSVEGRADDTGEGGEVGPAIGPGIETLTGSWPLAVALLRGSLALCGEMAPLELRYWLERTLGRAFRPESIEAPILRCDAESLTNEELTARARMVLDACPAWRDESELTYQLAAESLLRDDDEPDPVRDIGIFRYFFEQRLTCRVEQDRRMLAWMSAFWEAAGRAELARSALELAGHLGEPQHVVPGHPFLLELTRRSLAAAREALRGSQRRP